MKIKTKEELEQEIKVLQLQIEELNKQKEMTEKLNDIIPLEKFTIEEKCKFFDELYQFVLEIFEEVVERKYSDNDNSHYIYEKAFTILNPRNNSLLWNFYKKALK